MYLHIPSPCRHGLQQEILVHDLSVMKELLPLPGDKDMRAQDGKILHSKLLSLPNDIAFAGAVVSNRQRRKQLASRILLCKLYSIEREYTIRTSPPSALTLSRSFSDPGTRSISPNDVKMTLGCDAIAIAY